MRPPASLVTRVVYCVNQLPRVAWYVGHGLVLRRLSEAARRRAGARSRPRIRVDGAVPHRNRIYVDMAKLFLQDLANEPDPLPLIAPLHASALQRAIASGVSWIATALPPRALPHPLESDIVEAMRLRYNPIFMFVSNSIVMFGLAND